MGSFSLESWMKAENIEEVIEALDGIIATCQQRGSRLGYFPALYRKVTVRVKEGIEAGEFDDGPRMEALDVVFANRYLDAWEAWDRGASCTASWRVAFEAAPQWPPLVLQHLLLGMNAHINLDLGVAAAEVAPGAELAGLEGDFGRINEVLASLTGGVKEELAQVWPALGWLDRLAGQADDRVVDFSMRRARGEAWDFAQSLAPLDHDARQARVGDRDRAMAVLGERVRRPRGIVHPVALCIRVWERGSIPEIIELLR